MAQIPLFDITREHHVDSMIRPYLLPLVSAFVLASSAVAGETTDSINVGGRELKIPAPAGGFVRCDGVSPKWDEIMASMLPATNRMLASYGTQADQDALRAGTAADYSKNFNLQVIRQFEEKEFGTETFAGVKDQTAKEVKEAAAKAEQEINMAMASGSRKVSEELGVDAALKVSDTAMLGIFHEDSQSLGFSMALKVSATTPKGTEATKSVVSCMMQPVNGRLLMYYSTQPYGAEADRHQAEASVKAWANATFAANPQVKGPSARPGLFERVGRNALIGAIVGAALAVVFMVKKKITG